MTQHQGHKPAALWRRAAARFVDSCVMAVIQAVMIFVAFIIAALVTLESLLSDENLEQFMTLWVLLMVPASIPAYLFEVGATVRWGQTFGKRLADIRVIRWDGDAAEVDDQDSLAHRRIAARWAIPHGAGIVAAVIAAIVVLPGAQEASEFWGSVAGAFAVPWALVYASSLFDKNHRGWHDKAAGTVVILDPELQMSPGKPERSAARPGTSDPATRRDSSQSWGMVSDYYGPRHSRGADGTDERPSDTER